MCTDTSNTDEQAAARVLGFTRASWDNVSGMEKQPLSTLKEWVHLTTRERVAANVLGYSEYTWNQVDQQEQPLWMTKRWDELISLGEYQYPVRHTPLSLFMLGTTVSQLLFIEWQYCSSGHCIVITVFMAFWAVYTHRFTQLSCCCARW